MKREPTLQQRTWEVLENVRPDDPAARFVGLVIMGLIILNVVALIVDSVPWIGPPHQRWFDAFETASVMVFSLEYLARLWSCPADPLARGNWLTARLRFFFRPMTLIDLLAVLPWYLPFFHVDLRFVRSLRILRVFRVLKLARYMRAMTLFTIVLRRTREEMIISFLGLAVLLILASSGMYYLEHEGQPDKFSSIPAAMWWSIATLTTVGYGDVYPETSLGRVLAGLIAVLGVCTLAIPTGILAGAFTEELRARKEAEAARTITVQALRPARFCPHCGESLAAGDPLSSAGPPTEAPPSPD